MLPLVIGIAALVGYAVFFSTRDATVNDFSGLRQQYARDPSFRMRCNGEARILGKQAYKNRQTVRQVLTSGDVSLCNYGFLVGYIEAMTNGRGSIGQAMRTCRLVRKNGQAAHAYMECLKGIGTGTRSTDVCEQVSKGEEELNICVVGVMNKLAEESFTRGPLAKQGDPFGDCGLVSDRYQPHCYGSVAGMLIWSGRETFESALSLAQAIPNREGQIRAVRIIAKISYNKFADQRDQLASPCRSLPSHLRWQCFISLVQGAMELGVPGNEWEDGLAVCLSPLLTDEEEGRCVQFVLYQTEEVLYGRERVRQLCASFDESWKGYCHDYKKDFFSL